jgi:protein tyrosine phosphatase (PTP) superfamily phosphohydrolase (DUF442 family)
MVVQQAESGRPVKRKSLVRRLWNLRRSTLAWRPLLIAHAPSWSCRLFGRFAWYLDMLIVDHGVFRLFYQNRFRLGERAWRSAQPAPHDIRSLARQGLRTIVNLRGERQCGSYWLEQATCKRYGIALVDFKMRSRTPPTREELRALRELLDRIEYPILLHCKSGADRAGLASAFYRLLKEGAPMDLAKLQLSAWYGHFRHADTGVLDCFLEKYIEDTRHRPMPFLEWVDTVYDHEELKRSFQARGWAKRVVNGILRRE